ncbi:hypothetical protein B566_EDAN005258, partial [Ephemera danica]
MAVYGIVVATTARNLSDTRTRTFSCSSILCASYQPKQGRCWTLVLDVKLKEWAGIDDGASHR